MRISVAMCTWNGERFLANQLASIARQTRLPDELVVCDDQSSDHTVSIVRDFAATASFPIKIFLNENNLGYAANFAKAIAQCTGDLIALSDQDDNWYPARLERSQQEFADHPEAVLAFSDADLIDEHDRPLHQTLWSRLGFSGQRKQDLLQRKYIMLAKYRFVTGATVMFRADLRQHVLPIPPGWIHDEWITLVAAAYGDLRPIDQPLIRYRIHTSQQVGLKNKLEQRAHGNHWVRLAASAVELGELCDALASKPDTKRPVLPAYRKHLEFLRFRSHLPLVRAFRLLPVAARIPAYHVHASGWKSVVKDLITRRRRS